MEMSELDGSLGGMGWLLLLLLLLLLICICTIAYCYCCKKKKMGCCGRSKAKLEVEAEMEVEQWMVPTVTSQDLIDLRSEFLQFVNPHFGHDPPNHDQDCANSIFNE
jgi:hypothetical protein